MEAIAFLLYKTSDCKSAGWYEAQSDQSNVQHCWQQWILYNICPLHAATDQSKTSVPESCVISDDVFDRQIPSKD